MSEWIDSPRHPAFAAATALSTALGRAAAGRYLVEGAKLVRQALAGGLLREALVLPGHDELAAELSTAGVAVSRLAPQLLARLIGTGYDTSLEAVGVVERRVLAAPPAAGLLLAAEGLADPRNVGVLLRTAEAAGVAAVILSDDSADPFARPAVRSSTGSVLRQPLCLTADLPATLRRLREQQWRVVATSARATTSAWDCDLTGPVVLVVGSETDGLSAAAQAAADVTVAVPTHGGASSLNVAVAAGVLLYEALRQRGGGAR